MRFLQRRVHDIRKRAWQHKKALFHINKAIKELEIIYEHADHSYAYESLYFIIKNMKRYRAQKWFDYQMDLAILNVHRVFTA